MPEHEKNPPPVTEEELRDLPRWAIVAFAARCARRMHPLFEPGWPDAPEEHKEAVERAITLAERLAAEPPAQIAGADEVSTAAAGAVLAAYHADTDLANTVANAAYHAARAANDNLIGDWRSTIASYVAGDAANAATHSIKHRDGPPNGASRAAANAADAAAGAGANVILALRRDFELLRACAAKEGWTDKTPVPPAFFGPLWPDGEPEGWPDSAFHCEEESAEDAAPETLRLSFLVNEYADEEAAAEAIANFCRALSRYHIALGGEGLTIDDWRVFIPEPDPVEVC